MIFARRTNQGPDPHLEKKVTVFLVGAALGLVGIARDSSLLVGLAILVLVSGVVLGFFSGRARTEADDVSEEGDEEEGESLG